MGISSYGLIKRNSNKSFSDFFLASRDVPWFTAMLSIVATETSVLTFISVPGISYRGDWTFLQLALGYIVGRILVSIILLQPEYLTLCDKVCMISSASYSELALLSNPNMLKNSLHKFN